jgi:hypothetical protein
MPVRRRRRCIAALVADRWLCRESDDRYRILNAGARRPSVALERQAFQ